MILDRQGDAWRATFTRSASGLPRVEVYHEAHRRAFEIGHACERAVRRKFPGDFPREERLLRDKVKDCLAGLIGLTLFTSQFATGAAAVLKIAGH
jgi:hypothetical protein